MKSRIITGIIGAALLVAVLLLPPIAFFIAIAAVNALAMYELLVSTKFVLNRGVLAVSVLFAVGLPFALFFRSLTFSLALLLAYAAALACLQIAYHESLSVSHTGFAFLMAFVFPASFSCLAYLRLTSARDGVFYAILAIAMPWLCDIGAYFTGTFFGKHKLCPKISPKKTVEGLVGGFAVSVAGTVLIAWLYQTAFLKSAAAVSLWQIALLALACAPLSVIGDLFASIIKRQCGVKDYGSILPGHGGVMDRFDSIMLVAPLLVLLLPYLPLIY